MILAALFLTLAVQSSTAAEKLDLNPALKAPVSSGYKVGALFVDIESGKTLYEREAESALVPASTLKLFTTFAALEHWSAAHTFKTEFAIVDNTLWVRGEGDPSLVSEDIFVIAGELARQGIKSLTGGILLDQSALPAPKMGVTRLREDSIRAFNAPFGAINLNYNAIQIGIRPGAAKGKPAVVSFDPPSAFFELADPGAMKTGGTGIKVDFDRVSSAQTDRWQIRGEISAGKDELRRYFNVTQPALYFGHTLAQELKLRGVSIGPVRLASRPLSSVSSRSVHIHQSKPLREIVTLMNKFSNNFIAQTLGQLMGHEKITALMQVKTLHNASGLDRDDKLSPRTLVDLLTRAYRNYRIGPEFVSSLPIGGQDGTLDERFANLPIARIHLRGKTGFLDGVSTLAGYFERAGKPVAFAVLVNAPSAAAGDTRAWQKNLIQALTRE